jgi:hypothetical protein
VKKFKPMLLLGICLGLISIFIHPAQIARADNPSPTTSETDNYALLTGSGTAKQGFQSATQTNYLGGNNTFTVEAWVLPTETMTSTLGDIFTKTDMFQYQLSSGVYQVVYNGAGVSWRTAISTGVRARIGEWQHLAFVKSTNTFSFYFNGTLAYQVLDANNVPTTLTNTNSYTSIGSNPWNGSSNQASPGTNFFAGGIDEVKVWTTARSQSEIQTDMKTKTSPSASGLASYWDFNGTANTSTINDRTTLLNLGTKGTPNPTFPDVKSTDVSVGQTTVTFPRTYLNGTGGYQIPAGITSVTALVVGGGGGGGFDGGGGGGGGGVYQNSTLAVTPGASVVIEVGAGGSAVNGYVGGSWGCNGTWSGTATACSAGAGGTSKFSTVAASGGGGAGGIEGSGTNDSDASANVRGGGGGAGGQNTKVGTGSAGVGATNGGSVADTSNAGGGGGGSGTNAGAIGTVSAAGNGGAGTSASINSIIYGSGGAGGSYFSATLATGGSGASNGGTSAVAPTTPTANRGGGGGGGGNGNTPGNANGTAGAAGIVIIRYALQGGTTLSFTSAPTYRVATTITATATTAGRVTFFANNKRIPGCIRIATVGAGPITATCSWKPSLHGSIVISALITPTDSNYVSSTTVSPAVFTERRTTKRNQG